MRRQLHKNTPFYLVSMLVFALCALPIFLHLDQLPIRIYDEGRQAISAIEMSETGNYLVTTYEYEPEMWSVKPPLLIWLQSWCIDAFGIHEWSIRLPVAVLGFLLLVLMYGFVLRYLHSKASALLSIAILVCTSGFIATHAVRTGDYDVPLMLFTTGGVFSIYLYFRSELPKYLFIFFVFLSLGCLTKGVVGLMLGPGMLIYAIYQKKLLPLIKEKTFYLGMGIFLLTVVGFYLLREQYNPGYLAAVWDEELGGRFFKTKMQHVGPFYFYIEQIFITKFSPWSLLWLLSFFVKVEHKEQRDFIQFSNLIIVVFLMLISLSQTKISWYDLPVYPFIAINSAFILPELIQRISIPASWNKGLYKLAISAIIFSVFYTKSIWYSAYWMGENYVRYQHYISECIRKKDVHHRTFVCSGYFPNVDFYQKMYRAKGVHFERQHVKILEVGQVYLVPVYEMDQLQKRYEYEVIGDFYKNVIKEVHILSKK